MQPLKAVAFLICSAVFAAAATTAAAIPIHYLQGAGDGDPAGAITASGNTPIALTDLTNADLAGVQVLWITNGNNDAPPAAVTANLGALDAFVRAGGVLSYHDRYVSDGAFNMAEVLPGADGTAFVRDFSNAADIDILNNSTIVTNGLDDTSLDGGSASSHGYAPAGSLPVGAVALLNRGGAVNEIVDFFYPFAAGWVYYSTIPLDFYLAGAGPNPPQGNLANIYAVNEAAFQASLAVPEPPLPALLGLVLGTLALAAGARRNRSARLKGSFRR